VDQVQHIRTVGRRRHGQLVDRAARRTLVDIPAAQPGDQVFQEQPQRRPVAMAETNRSRVLDRPFEALPRLLGIRSQQRAGDLP